MGSASSSDDFFKPAAAGGGTSALAAVSPRARAAVAAAESADRAGAPLHEAGASVPSEGGAEVDSLRDMAHEVNDFAALLCKMESVVIKYRWEGYGVELLIYGAFLASVFVVRQGQAVYTRLYALRIPRPKARSSQSANGKSTFESRVVTGRVTDASLVTPLASPSALTTATDH